MQENSTSIGKKVNIYAEHGFHQRDSDYGQSIFKMLDKVMLQVEYHCFVDLNLNRIDPLYKELCLIIAEVLVLSYDSSVKINGSIMPAHVVQEVYSQLSNDHVRLVFGNLHNVTHRIYNKKAYIRTSLYNAVFEIESHFVNDMAVIDRLTDRLTDRQTD